MQSGRQAVEQGRQLRELVPENPVIRFDLGMSLEFLAYVGDSAGSVPVGGAEQLGGRRAVPLAESRRPERGPLQELALPGPRSPGPGSGQARPTGPGRRGISRNPRVARPDGPRGLRSISSSARGSSSSSMPAAPFWPNKAVGPRSSVSLEANVQRCEVLFLRTADDWTFLRGLIDSKSCPGRSPPTGPVGSPRPRRSPRCRRFSPRPRPTHADSTRPSIRFQRGRGPVPTGGPQGRGRRRRRGRIDLGSGRRADGGGDGVAPPAPALETRPRPGRFTPRQSSIAGPIAGPRPSPTPAAPWSSSSRPSSRAPAISTSWAHSRQPTATSPTSSGTYTGEDAPPDLRTCLDTLNKAVSGGFDNAARLRQDPRLKVLRERRKPEFERLVAGALAAGKAPAPAVTAPGRVP